MRILFKIVILLNFAIALTAADFLKIEKNAKEFGYKAANLICLEQAIKDINQKLGQGIFYIPSFMPVSSDVIIEVLSELGLNAEAEFKNNNPEVFQKKLQDFFNNIALQKTEDNFINVLKLKIGNDWKEFDKPLMVRSTGKEDTDTLSNAGGNESVANVKGAEIVSAIGKVIASYYGKKSTEQTGGQKSESLFLPVLIQEMIGENENVIPTSGVLFTVNPAANEGIIIQSTYGHGTAVVNSLKSTDTYYVLGDTIVPIIYSKTSRLKPDSSAELVDFPNDLKLQKQSSLSPTQISQLKIFADTLADFYKKPMDVEFVILKEKIYIVQVRPIVLQKYYTSPSYLDHYQSVIRNSLIKGKSIVLGNQSVQSITNPNEVIVTDTIQEALNDFLFSKNQNAKKAIKAIVVGKNAPSTSHEATIFRENGKVVLYFPLKQFEEIKKQLKQPFLLSPQQGFFSASPDSKQYIKQGLVSYPMPSEVSIFPEFVKYDEAIMQGILEKQLNLKITKFSVRQILEQLKTTNDLNTSKPLLAELAYKSMARFLKIQEDFTQSKNKDDDLIRQIEGYKQFIKAYISGLYKSFENGSKEAILFHITALESVLFQDYDVEVVNGLSIEKFGNKVLEEEFSIINNSEKLNNPETVQYLKLAKFAQNEEAAGMYKQFILFLDQYQNQEQKNNFKEMFLDLEDILPVWINTVFFQNCKNMQNEKLLFNLLSLYQAEKQTLKEVKKIQEKIKNFNPQIFSYGNEQVYKNLKILNFVDHGIISNLMNGSLSPLVLIETLRELTNKFDLSIKALKTSALISEKKVEAIRAILSEYLEFMKIVVCCKNKDISQNSMQNNALFSGSGLVSKSAYIYGKDALSVNTYYEQLENVIESEKVISLNPSPGFNVNNFVMGSGFNITANNGNNIKTLEDAFTTIHQNLLAILSRLTLLTVNGNLAISKGLTVAEKLLPQSAQLISISFKNNSAEFQYNIPLQNHSIQISLSSKANSEDLHVTFDLLDRHPHMVRFIYNEALLRNLIDDIGIENITIKPNLKTPMQLSIQSKVKSKNFKKFFDLLGYLSNSEILTVTDHDNKDITQISSDWIKSNFNDSTIDKFIKLTHKLDWSGFYKSNGSKDMAVNIDALTNFLNYNNKKYNVADKKAITQIITPNITWWVNKNSIEHYKYDLVDLIKKQIENYSSCKKDALRTPKCDDLDSYFAYDSYLIKLLDMLTKKVLSKDDTIHLINYILDKSLQDNVLAYQAKSNNWKLEPPIMMFLNDLGKVDEISEIEKTKIFMKCDLLYKNYIKYLESFKINEKFMDLQKTSERFLEYKEEFLPVKIIKNLRDNFDFASKVSTENIGYGHFHNLQTVYDCLYELPEILTDEQIQRTLEASSQDRFTGPGIVCSQIANFIIENLFNRISDSDIYRTYCRFRADGQWMHAFCNPQILKRLPKDKLQQIKNDQNFLEDVKQRLSKNFQNGNSWLLPEDIETEQGFAKWLDGLK